MHFFSKNPKILPLLLILLFIPAVAYGEDGEGNHTAITLGWISIGSGLVANLSLVIFNMVRKTSILKLVGGPEISQGIVPIYKPILNFHIMLNSVGYFAGLSHGLLLIHELDAISLSLVIVMTVSMISGIILKYASDKDLKIFGRLVHGQFILAVLLITLVILHIITHGGEFD